MNKRAKFLLITFTEELMRFMKYYKAQAQKVNIKETIEPPFLLI